jgi:hypothetical protein
MSPDVEKDELSPPPLLPAALIEPATPPLLIELMMHLRCWRSCR